MTGEKGLIPKERINELPVIRFSDKIVVIESAAKAEECATALLDEPLIGFDCESRPSFTKGVQYPVSLIQLATPHTVYLFRNGKTKITPTLLSIFERSSILKIGVGVRDDIRFLQREKKFTAQGFIDLATLSKYLGYEAAGIKNLTASFLRRKINKQAQTSNWEAQTLTEKQIHYAATDAWVCLQIFDQMKKRHPADIENWLKQNQSIKPEANV